jgi:hypothetical protein
VRTVDVDQLHPPNRASMPRPARDGNRLARWCPRVWPATTAVGVAE